jgi:hypothetical protein
MSRRQRQEEELEAMENGNEPEASAFGGWDDQDDGNEHMTTEATPENIRRSSRSATQNYNAAVLESKRMHVANNKRLTNNRNKKPYELVSSLGAGLISPICDGPHGTRSDVSCGFRSDGSACGIHSNDSEDCSSWPLAYKTVKQSKKYTCAVHGEESWESACHAAATTRQAKGRLPTASRTFVCGLSSRNIRVSAYLKCERCKQFVCIECAQLFLEKIAEYKDQANTPWSMAVHQLLDAKLPAGESPETTIVLEIPGSISHCCELTVRRIASGESQKHRKRQSPGAVVSSSKRTSKDYVSSIRNKTSISNATSASVDGIFGLVGYDVAICPSLKYPDTLSLAQMGNQGKSDRARYQQAVSHSVIPNKLAFQYQHSNIAPVGVLSDIKLFDTTKDVSTLCPLDGSHMIVKVRMIGICRSTAANDTVPPRGGCHFDNPEVFKRCVPLFDSEMVLADLCNKIDVTMVLGEASPEDNGKAYFNLTTRFYNSKWSIPQYNDSQLDVLSSNLFSSLPKKGFECMRRGGSSGVALPDKDFFDYFAQHKGSSPRKTCAVKFIQQGLTWQMLYITPYKCDIAIACPPSMGTPRHGGQIQITGKNILGYEEFFKRFVYVRALTGCLLHAINGQYGISVVPDAVANQLKQNERARTYSDSISGRFAYLINACSFTLVAHAVGDHVDTVKGSNCKGSDRSFIENRALFQSPSDSTGSKNAMSQWRGGNGPGVAVYAIVDHPRPCDTSSDSVTIESLTDALSLDTGAEGGIQVVYW